MKVAIVGSGISGLAAAHCLAGHAEITLFEAASHFGGHAHTVDIRRPGRGGNLSHGVDTGFLVFNEKTYPNLIKLFSDLGVETAKSEMSFSVQVTHAVGAGKLEWGGSSLNSVFAQRRNLFNPSFLTMLLDLRRFNALATDIAKNGREAAMHQPLGEFLRQHRFSDAFCDWYFLPMMACIWSCPTAQMLQFPVATMLRFCHNHGLIQLSDRPQWWTVTGGARNYVDKILSRVADKRIRTAVRQIKRLGNHRDGAVRIATDTGSEHFDKVVLATHSDQALALLTDSTEAEREVLGAIRYQPNRVVLHTDASVLPLRRSAWAAWNYESAPGNSVDHEPHGRPVCLHYLLNRLQPLPWADPVLVSLNPLHEIARSYVMGEYNYAHPVFDLAAIKAQGEMARLQGESNTYFCGAWMGYGFHEDGLNAGQDVARRLLAEIDGRKMGLA